MTKWAMMRTVGVVIVASLLISLIFFPIGHISGNTTNTNQYPIYGNSKVVVEAKGSSIGNWSISHGNGTAIMVNFTLSKNAIMTGSWNSTIPTAVYVVNYTADKTYLKLPSTSSSYAISGSFDSLHLLAGKYLLIVGTIFHGNETVTFNQPLAATYIT